MQDLHDLGLIIDRKTPIIAIESYEEDRALQMLTRLAMKRGQILCRWTLTDGLDRLGFGVDPAKNTDKPEKVLKYIKDSAPDGIYVLCDFHSFLEDSALNTRLLKDIALNSSNGGASQKKTIILLSHSINIPPEIKKHTAFFELCLPSEEQLMGVVREEAGLWSKNNQQQRVKTDNHTLKHLVKNLQGLTLSDARSLIHGAIVDDGAITQHDIPAINKAKFELLDMEDVLSFEYDTAHFSEVAGLNNLKQWLTQREAAINAPFDAASSPRGIMLLGVQGGGKSLAAKAVSGMWGLPLLRLDFGALYNKFFGETERRLRESLKLAELMSPCVLWMDEIEKGIAADGNDSGVSSRVLGTLLTWMAERKHNVFIVATSNDITGLPPELVRKGRLDEIFFVDLPEQKVREEIYRIHLKKRNLDPTQFNLLELALCCEGFSGAEIEQSVVSAIHSSSAKNVTVNTAGIIQEIYNTSPLSRVMDDKINALREWADGRTVSAD